MSPYSAHRSPAFPPVRPGDPAERRNANHGEGVQRYRQH